MNNFFLLILILFSYVGLAQNGKVYPKNDIKQGEMNTYVYEAPTGIEIPTNAWVLGKSDNYNSISVPLNKKGSRYEFSFRNLDSDNIFILKITNNKRVDIDNNNNNGYRIVLNKKLTKEEISLNEIHLWNFTENNLRREELLKKQVSKYEELFETNPKLKTQYAYSDYLYLKYILNPESTLPKIIKQIDFLRENETEINLAYVAQFYNLIKMFDKAEEILDLKQKKYPKQKDELEKKLKFIDQFRNTPNKTEYFIKKQQQEYVSTFKDSSEDSNLNFQEELLKIYLKEKNSFKTEEIANSIKDKSYLAFLYNEYAWELSGQNLVTLGNDLKYAELLSEKSLDLIQNVISSTDSSNLLIFYTDYYIYSDTYALILYKLKRYDEAFAYQDKIVRDVESDVGVKERYAAYAEKVKGADFTKKYIENELRKGTESKILVDQLERLYQELKLSNADFDTIKNQHTKQATERAKKEVLKIYGDIKAPQFELENLNGSKIKLSDYKGKLVVLDFWATWCAPCKASFPHMQELVNQYKDYNVTFLFIDTWERGSQDKIKERVSQFIKDKNYTFNVLYDLDNSIKDVYLVKGIPTKIVIDSEGHIISVNSTDSDLKALIEENK